MTSLKLKLLTPAGTFLDEEVEWLNFSNSIGRIEILPGHTKYMSEVLPCILEVKKDNAVKKMVVTQGFINFADDEALLTVESVEWPENIDTKRAQEAYERAKKRLKSSSPDIDVRRAELALMRASERLKANKHKD